MPSSSESYVRPDWLAGRKVDVVLEVERLPRLLAAITMIGLCAIDTETQGLDDRFDDSGQTRHKIVAYVLAPSDRHAFILPVRFVHAANLPLDVVNDFIRRLCHAAFTGQIKLLFHHSKYDQSMMSEATGYVRWPAHAYEDSMFNAYALASNEPKGLKPQVRVKLGWQMLELSGLVSTSKQSELPRVLRDLGELTRDTKPREQRDYNFAQLTLDQRTCDYAGGDGLATFALHRDQDKRLTASERRIIALEKRVMQIVRDIERHQISVDIPLVERTLHHYARLYDLRKRQLRLIASMRGHDGMNVRSSQQISKLLFSPAGFGVTPRPPTMQSAVKALAALSGDEQHKLRDALEASGKLYTTQKVELERFLRDGANIDPLAREFIESSLALGHIAKRIKTYLLPLLAVSREGQVRASYNQLMVTGRFSQKAHKFGGATLQGIPHEAVFRRMFTARLGYLWLKYDYASQEPRLAGNLSGDPLLTEFFLFGDGDLHSRTAELMFGRAVGKKSAERQAAKTVGLSVMYGIGPTKLAARLSIDLGREVSKGEAKTLIKQWHAAWPTLSKWLKNKAKEARRNHGVRTALFERLAPTDKVFWRKDGASLVYPQEHKGGNFSIQSTAAEQLKVSLVRIDALIRERGWQQDVHILLTAHDEIDLEVRAELVAEVAPLVRAIMESAVRSEWPIPMPVELQIGHAWGGGYTCVPASDDLDPSAWEIAGGIAVARQRTEDVPEPGTPDESLFADEVEASRDGKTYTVRRADFFGHAKREVAA